MSTDPTRSPTGPTEFAQAHRPTGAGLHPVHPGFCEGEAGEGSPALWRRAHEGSARGVSPRSNALSHALSHAKTWWILGNEESRFRPWIEESDEAHSMITGFISLRRFVRVAYE